MPVTPQQIEQAYSLFRELKVQPSGDFKADSTAALKNFVGTYNRNKGDEASALNFSGEYTEAFGTEVIQAASVLKANLERGLEGLRSSNAIKSNIASSRLEKAFEGESFPANVTTLEQKTLYTIRQLEVAGVINTLNQAKADNWEIESNVEEVVNNTPASDFDFTSYEQKIRTGVGRSLTDEQFQNLSEEEFFGLEQMHLNRQIESIASLVEYLGIEDFPPKPDLQSPQYGVQLEAYLKGFVDNESKLHTGIQAKYDGLSVGNHISDFFADIGSAMSPAVPNVTDKRMVEINDAVIDKALANVKEIIAVKEAQLHVREEVVPIPNDGSVDGGVGSYLGIPGTGAASEGTMTKEQSAGEIVEQTLQGLAPFLKSQGLELDLTGVDPANKGFDKNAQIALQKFLFALDAKGIVDLGDEPWKYTEEKGELIKKALLSDAFQKQYGDALGDDLKKSLKESNLSVLIVSLNALKNSQDEKNKLSETLLFQQSDMLPPQMKLIGFLVGMLAPYIPESMMNGISSFCEKVFGFDLKSIIPADAQSGEFGVGDFFGVTGDKTSDAAKLEKLYEDAIAATGGDAKAVRDQVKQGIKSLFSGANDPKKEKLYMDAADKAFDKAEKILQESPDKKNYASDVFVGEFLEGVNNLDRAKEGDRIRAAGFKEYDDQQGYKIPKVKQTPRQENPGETAFKTTQARAWDKNSGETREEYLKYAFELRNEQKHISRAKGNLVARPDFLREAGGRTFMHYYDRDVANELKYLNGEYRNGKLIRQGRIGALEDALKEYDKQIEKYDRAIANQQSILDGKDKDLGQYAAEKKKHVNDLIRKKQLYVDDNAGRVNRLKTDLQDLKARAGELSGKIYKRVDVTDELIELENAAVRGELDQYGGGFLGAKKDFPGLSQAIKHYPGWTDIKRVHTLMQTDDHIKHAERYDKEYVPLSKQRKQKLSSIEQRKAEKRQEKRQDAFHETRAKISFNKATKFVGDWNDLEDRRTALRAEREDIVKKYGDLTRDEYIEWEDKWDQLVRDFDKLESKYKTKLESNDYVHFTADDKRVAFKMNKVQFSDYNISMVDTDLKVQKTQPAHQQ